MRIRTTLTALAAIAAVLVPGAPSATAAGPNWALFRVDLRPAANWFDYSFKVAEFVPQATHTMHLNALGRAGEQWLAMLQEDEHLYGGHVYPTADLTAPVDVSVGVPLTDQSQPGQYAVHGSVGAAAGTSVYLLFASLTGTFTGTPSLVVTHATATATLVTRGGDAGYLAARGTGTTGIGVGVSGLGPARTANTATFGRGALFTVPVFDCYLGDCTWDGLAPDGTTLHHVDHVVRGGGSGEGPYTITGPAGTWHWSLDALGYDGYAMVGYVPIGRYVNV